MDRPICDCGHHRIEHPDGGHCEHSENPATAGGDGQARCTCGGYREDRRFVIAA